MSQIFRMSVRSSLFILLRQASQVTLISNKLLMIRRPKLARKQELMLLYTLKMDKYIKQSQTMSFKVL